MLWINTVVVFVLFCMYCIFGLLLFMICAFVLCILCVSVCVFLYKRLFAGVVDDFVNLKVKIFSLVVQFKS